MKQAGFTLIELMVSLTLGLIIVASAMLLLLSGQKNIALQSGSASLQDDQNFGLSYITSHIRMANLNTSSSTVNPSTRYSGIIFNKDNLVNGITALDENYTSKETTTKSNFLKETATTEDMNDQLVIQYRPAETGTYDCEGNLINDKNIYVVERYFVRLDTAISTETTNQEKMVLACKAARYNANSTDLAAIAGNGEIILKRIELFKVRFLVQTDTGKRYMTLKDYNGLTTTKPRILTIQLGMVTRASGPTTENSVPTQQVFKIFGNDFKVVSGQPRRYLRSPIVQTVALRNALGSR